MRPGVQGLVGAELFGDHQRRMIGQHDPARADPNAFGRPGDLADHHGGRGTGDARHVVVLGDPEPLEPQPVGHLGVGGRFQQRLPGIAPLDDGRQVKHGELGHGPKIGSMRCDSRPAVRRGRRGDGPRPGASARA